MYSNSIEKEVLKDDFLETINLSNDCKVSNASTELMIERFCNGKRIEFPFSQKSSKNTD